ncbi:MAG: cysteine--tRNA ligase [Candidatus Babeliales bacterium]
MNVIITNSLSGKKELFTSRKKHEVSLYVCGITPYDYAHLGHGRVYVVFDVLYRLLTFLGNKVRYVRNFTDIDDKLLKKAHEQFKDELRYQEIATQFITAYQEDMDRLNCLSPDVQPRVTENIPEIIAFIQGLIDAHKAYVSNGDVYFSVRSFAEYGKLSKRNIDDLRIGARVEVNELKKDPLDFALWKSTLAGSFWQAPWGWGRPGWHIECSALAHKFLGDHIDIHAGGEDLKFPHHENEIAQSEGLLGPNFANYWMHNAFVLINQEKMSKSLGNFFTLRQIFEKFDPMVVRYYILAHQYGKPLNFSLDDIAAIEKSYRRLCVIFSAADCSAMSKDELLVYPIIQELLATLLDDLDTAGFLAVLHENLTFLQENLAQLCAVKQFIQTVLGLSLEPLPEKLVEITPEIRQIMRDREAARAAKNWAKADELRDTLIALGVDLKDKKIT